MKAVFLDRDGVINQYPGHRKYVTSLRKFRFIPGATRALKKLGDSGYAIFIISNQAGVSKGAYAQSTLDRITSRMLNELKKHKVDIAGVYYCTHLPDARCPCRKPGTGLFKKALKEHKISSRILRSSFFVGDSIMDVQTAANAGMKSILVFSGREKARNRRLWPLAPDFTAKDLSGATRIIINSALK